MYVMPFVCLKIEQAATHAAAPSAAAQSATQQPSVSSNNNSTTSHGTTESVQNDDGQETEQLRPMKRFKFLSQKLDNVANLPNTTADTRISSFERETSDYLSKLETSRFANVTDPLKFWSENVHQYETLAPIAEDLIYQHQQARPTLNVYSQLVET